MKGFQMGSELSYIISSIYVSIMLKMWFIGGHFSQEIDVQVGARCAVFENSKDGICPVYFSYGVVVTVVVIEDSPKTS
jgi:hypothetical protein